MTNLRKNFEIREYIGIVILIMISLVSSILFKDYIIQLHGAFLIVIPLFIGVVPGLIWLYFFYHKDKYEKEPVLVLVGVYVLSAVIAYFLSYQLESFIRTKLHYELEPLQLFFHSVLIYACLQELIKFLVLRYSIYHSVEFNEPADGIIYGATIGLGFATAYNTAYLYSLSGSLNLGVVITRVIEFYLIQASFTGVLGYFFGKAKFNSNPKKQERLVSKGFLFALLLNGLYRFISEMIRGTEFVAWRNIAISSFFVLLVFVLLNILLKKLVESSPFKKTNME